MVHVVCLLKGRICGWASPTSSAQTEVCKTATQVGTESNVLSLSSFLLALLGGCSTLHLQLWLGVVGINHVPVGCSWGKGLAVPFQAYMLIMSCQQQHQHWASVGAMPGVVSDGLHHSHRLHPTMGQVASVMIPACRWKGITCLSGTAACHQACLVSWLVYFCTAA